MDEFNYKEINYNQGNFFGYISQGKIFNQFHQQVGVTIDEYNKAIKTAKDFENVLYEKGILERPKTPEQINQELQETIKQQQAALSSMMQAISDMGEKISKLEVRDDRQSNGSVDTGDALKDNEASNVSKAKASLRVSK